MLAKEILISKATRCLVNDELIKIGVDGENLQEKLVFKFYDGFVNGQARAEILLQDGTKSYVTLNKVDESYELPIKSIITKKGLNYIQLVITEGTDDEDIPVFKSEKIPVYVSESIDAIQEAPEGYDEWIDVANAKLNQIDNFDIEAEQTETGSTITITKKDGTEETIELFNGAKGDKGDKGDTGLTGPTGPQGIQGIQGERGLTGEQGPQGERGEKGDTGSTGATGPAGPKGDTGERGPAGSDGQDGQDGFSPIANVSQSGDITTISITDKNGTTTADIDLSGVGGGSTVEIITDLLDETYTNRINFKKSKVGTYVNNKGTSIQFINKLADDWSGFSSIDNLETLYVVEDISNITTLESDLIFAYAIVWQFGETLKLMKFTLNTSLLISATQTSLLPQITSLTQSSQQIQGEKTFLTIPKLNGTLTPTQDAHLVNKKYVDDSLANVGGDTTFLGKVSEHNTTQTAISLNGLKKGVYIIYADTTYLHLKITNTTTGQDVEGTILTTSDENAYVFNKNIYLFIKDDIPTEGLPTNSTNIGVINYIRKNVYNEQLGIYNYSMSISVNSSMLGIGTGSVSVYSYSTSSSNETITGTKTFNTLPVSSIVPTTDNHFVNKKYVDDKIGDINTILATLTTPGGNE